MLNENEIPPNFLQYAADILADTNGGLSGTEIVRETAAYAVEYDVPLPHPTYPFQASNKRTALYENLRAFSGPQQYRILRELCDHRSFGLTRSAKRTELKQRLATRYGHLAEHPSSEVNETLIEETRHWLREHPEVLSLYNQAFTKLETGSFHRNLLDDLRLSLEKLLRGIFGNEKSLENQINSLGTYIKSKGGSPELANMFVKLADYYAKFQNTYVKHDDQVNEAEVEFVFEITSSFMKHLIRLQSISAN
ncbi:MULTISPECIES: hypothetical protein [unclassified Bradyrhizobium]|uniref:hypothetical protein n=1 Tax=unclassified Bradyrhizobium TaxID=2631580 RepID=UPI001CD5172B|nr:MULTISPECIES: hypothetical protein [unclassified Bradyrhizobium]MCA1376472.1 hypothetical protein [Bradyrhizobium sp. IC4060]MCA1484237.1 hypothetical protein [Bradyrhizobium sp. IC4061]MCA1539837.1 hypothetical protein [Bradyrhizobium sp. NBAIM32]